MGKFDEMPGSGEKTPNFEPERQLLIDLANNSQLDIQDCKRESGSSPAANMHTDSHKWGTLTATVNGHSVSLRFDETYAGDNGRQESCESSITIDGKELAGYSIGDELETAY